MVGSLKSIRVCLVCSAGGHLAELRQLKQFYEKFNHFFVTFRRPDSEKLAENNSVFFVERPGRNIFKTIKAIAQSLRILIKENPDLILSTGADVAVPICVLGKLMGKKVVFVESFCRTEKPSWSGRMVYPFSDLFIYQWPSLARSYPKGKFGGSIF